MIKLLYGTSNVSKIQHMKRMLDGLDIEIISLEDMDNPDMPSISENGNRPLENARIKAMTYYRELKIPVFSCDSGLYIDGLENQRQPGVHIRRVNGKELSDNEMIDYYTSLASNLGGQAKAKYKNAICLIVDEEHIFEYDGEDIASKEFILTSKPNIKRRRGYPLDSISVEIETGQYYMDIQGQDNSDEINKMAEGFKNFFRKAVLNSNVSF